MPRAIRPDGIETKPYPDKSINRVIIKPIIEPLTDIIQVTTFLWSPWRTAPKAHEIITRLQATPARIKLKDKINEIKILPEYIALFFNLKSGQRLTLRSTTGGTRPALDYTAIKDLILTLPKFEKQKEILEKIKQAYSQRKQKEAKAQQLLDSINDYVLDELGIKFSPMIEDKTYSINSEELETNRSDPYYFNPKFKRILADLKKSEIKLV